MNTEPNSGHLTSKEISRCLVEGTSVEAEAHLGACWRCQAKLAEAREPLRIFRSAVVAWSERQSIAPPRMSVDKASRGRRLLNWMPVASAALAAMVLMAFLVGSGEWNRHSESNNGLTQTATNRVVDDTVLMNQVDEEVSETVPDAMAPLADLVAWDSGSGATAAAKPVVRKKTAAGATSKPRTHVTD